MKILPYLFFLLWTITITSCAPQESSSGKNTATQVHQLLQDGKRFEQENKVKQAVEGRWGFQAPTSSSHMTTPAMRASRDEGAAKLDVVFNGKC